MKKIKLITFFTIAFLIGQSQTKNFLDQPYIEVAGNADTLVTPNEIFIKIYISEKDTKDKVSIEELEIKMANSLKSLGIDIEKNLITSDMSSNFKFYFLKSKDIIKSKQYILKVGDAVTASKVFIQLEDIGISNTSIDRVNYSDIEGMKNILRTKAIENARARAIALTKPLNQSLGSAIHITDNEVYNVNQQLQGRISGVVVVGYASKGKASDDMSKIEFEKISILTNINVKFILK